MKEEEQEIITVVITTLLTGIIVAIGTKYNNNSISLFQRINSSIIDVGAWDISFNNINKFTLLVQPTYLQSKIMEYKNIIERKQQIDKT